MSVGCWWTSPNAAAALSPRSAASPPRSGRHASLPRKVWTIFVARLRHWLTRRADEIRNKERDMKIGIVSAVNYIFDLQALSIHRTLFLGIFTGLGWFIAFSFIEKSKTDV